MVATRVTLLSLAAMSSCMFGNFRREQRVGRFDRRLAQSNDTSSAVSPGSVAASTNDAATTLKTTPTVSSEAPLAAAARLTETQMSFSEYIDEFPYPPDFATGDVSSGFSSTPSISADPSHATASITPASAVVMPTTDITKLSASESRVDYSPSTTRIKPPNLVKSTTPPTLPDKQPDDGEESTVITIDLGKTTSVSSESDADTTIFIVPTAATTWPPSNVTSGNDTLGWNRTALTTTTTSYSTETNATLADSGWVTMTDTASVSYCQPSDKVKGKTSYSIIYTETITWTGNPKDYTPPYPPDTFPTSTCVDTKTPVRWTVSRCLPSGTQFVTCETFVTQTAASTTIPFGISVTPKISKGGGGASDQATIVLVTAHNPTVIFSSNTPPDYGGAPTKQENQHGSATVGGKSISTPLYDGGGNGGGPKTLARAPVTVAVQPSGVVIDGHTFSDSPQARTQVVTVNGNEFTINPSQVVGAGATVNRPGAVGGIFVPTPTTTNLGGLSVVVSSSVAVIDGTTFTIPMEASTAVVKGQTVTLGPGGIAIASQTVQVTVVALPTSVVIAGGELITAIGQTQIVIDGQTINYGSGSSSVTVIDGDSITIGPSGITIHGTTIGGPEAGPTDTQYEIVGGATITEIGASIVVIDGHTFTVGPGTPTTTTVIGGETITLGPSGVSISTVSFPYPFGPTTTITPGATAAQASQTSKDAGSSVRPDRILSMFLTCIAIGVRVFGFLL